MLYLASSSPRRKELLQMAGETFEVVPAYADESVPSGTPPFEAVQLLARRKASAVFNRPGICPNDIILAADTLVSLDGAALGKPKDEADAQRMLTLLSGHVHEVATGFCLLSAQGEICGAERTEVEFYPLSKQEITAYIRTGEPMDKAGAYGIQGRGALLVKRINGDFYNVMGLPIARIERLLHKKQEI